MLVASCRFEASCWAGKCGQTLDKSRLGIDVDLTDGVGLVIDQAQTRGAGLAERGGSACSNRLAKCWEVGESLPMALSSRETQVNEGLVRDWNQAGVPQKKGRLGVG